MFLVVFLGSCSPKYNFTACFEMDKTTGEVDEEITFTDCSDYDGDTPWAFWNFGDGTTANTQNKEPITHKYAAPGKYDIYLLIGYKEGPASSITKEIEISP